MWNIKQKVTNKTNENILIDTDNKMLVSRGEGVWERVLWVKQVKI